MSKLEQPLKDWNRDILVNIEDEYNSLLRTLKIIDNFGLLFVRCSPAKGTKLIQRIKQDIIGKDIEILKLDKPINNLYEKIDALSYKTKFNILFIRGIEKSFTKYIKSRYDGNSYFYQKDSVPRVLGHLNLQRERFRDNFNFCIVFLVRSFGLNYFIHRAPDFFDWRSGVFNYKDIEEKLILEIDGELAEELSMKSEFKSQLLPEIMTESVNSYLAYQEVNDV